MKIVFIALLALAAPVSTAAQSIASGLTGTWVLQDDANAARSRRPITGLSIATRLVISQTPGEVAVDSNTGTGNTVVTTTYKLDGSEHPIPGPIGWETNAKSTWDGSRLVVAIRRAVQGPEGELTFDILETYTRAQDTLTLERKQGRTVQTLVYRKE